MASPGLAPAGRLAADPQVRLCVDHLPADQHHAFEHDLAAAAQIQRGLLPRLDPIVPGWEFAYHYEAARVVSGDYCDLFARGDDLYFAVGDVTGKGVGAAMLMTHLSATLRSLVAQSLPVADILDRASRIFCESSQPSQFVTMVLGRAAADGTVEMSIAGHMPALRVRRSGVDRIHSTALPVGMFCDQRFVAAPVRIAPGEALVLYTDGITEALSPAAEEFGIDRLAAVIGSNAQVSAQEQVDASLRDLRAFGDGVPPADDVTLLVLRRTDEPTRGARAVA